MTKNSNQNQIQIGDVVFFEREKKDGYEFYQLSNRSLNVPDTGFSRIDPESPAGLDLLQKNIGDEFKISAFGLTVKNFFAPEDALERLIAPDEDKERNQDYVYRGDYTLCACPKGLELIRWGLITDSDLNVFGLHCFYEPDGTNELPEIFKVGCTYEYGIQRYPFTVKTSISNETFQKRFGIK